MQHNLSHKTVVEDGAMGGVASADELLVFRKRGASTEPAGTRPGSTTTPGREQVPADLAKYRNWSGKRTENRYSHWIWRRYASSVWTTCA